MIAPSHGVDDDVLDLDLTDFDPLAADDGGETMPELETVVTSPGSMGPQELDIDISDDETIDASGMRFDLGMDDSSPPTVGLGTIDEGPGGDDEADPTLMLGGRLAELDETQTKLDLAEQYISMGDKEGAQEIIDEVLAGGGDESHQSRARQLQERL